MEEEIKLLDRRHYELQMFSRVLDSLRMYLLANPPVYSDQGLEFSVTAIDDILGSDDTFGSLGVILAPEIRSIFRERLSVLTIQRTAQAFEARLKEIENKTRDALIRIEVRRNPLLEERDKLFNQINMMDKESETIWEYVAQMRMESSTQQ